MVRVVYQEANETNSFTAKLANGIENIEELVTNIEFCEDNEYIDFVKEDDKTIYVNRNCIISIEEI